MDMPKLNNLNTIEENDQSSESSYGASEGIHSLSSPQNTSAHPAFSPSRKKKTRDPVTPDPSLAPSDYVSELSDSSGTLCLHTPPRFETVGSGVFSSPESTKVLITSSSSDLYLSSDSSSMYETSENTSLNSLQALSEIDKNIVTTKDKATQTPPTPASPRSLLDEWLFWLLPCCKPTANNASFLLLASGAVILTTGLGLSLAPCIQMAGAAFVGFGALLGMFGQFGKQVDETTPEAGDAPGHHANNNFK